MAGTLLGASSDIGADGVKNVKLSWVWMGMGSRKSSRALFV